MGQESHHGPGGDRHAVRARRWDPDRASTEDDPDNTEGPVGGRGRTADAVLALADGGVRSAVVRPPRSVHLRGAAYGFCSILIGHAHQTGVSA